MHQIFYPSKELRGLNNLNSIEKDVSTVTIDEPIGNNNQCEEEEKIMIFQMIRMIRIKKQKILRNELLKQIQQTRLYHLRRNDRNINIKSYNYINLSSNAMY
ncbi:hypothetical protein H8356DRAFT_1351630 [Neocallimastix lanati (nom. inval.)]|nr:hypothetical protein H8356DRAFT_1351630 [Neocallimastix sp. JGI-2020a]